jgi:hypothetical protein
MSPLQRVLTLLLILAGLALPLAALALLYVVVFDVFELGGVTTIRPDRVDVVRLDQGWGEPLARAYHHRSQGTKILPYDWFVALEQPLLTPLPVGLYARRDYLSRFGFLYDDSDPVPGAVDLPIGFSIEDAFLAPYAKPPVRTPTRVVGLTCAGCHTGRIDVSKDGRLKGLLIEGGSASIHITSYQDATGRALYYTTLFRARFNRFARRVLKKDLPDGDPEKERLRSDLQTYIDTGLATQNYAKEHKLIPVDSGFSRTDALGLIGNRVFGVLNEENQVVTDAPVNFPQIWDTSWFDWVQYNASIRMPMARNIGEALGVGALVNLDGRRGDLYASTVNVEGLHWMEDQLGGDNPFEGLQPPRWDPDLLGAIQPPLAEKGKALYRAHCAGCHLPPRDELKADLASAEPKHFTRVDPWGQKRFLKVPVIDLYEIGTDPNQALNFYRRVAVSPSKHPAGGSGRARVPQDDTIPAKVGLFRITSLIRKQKYEALKLLAPGPSPDGPDRVVDLPRLKAYDRYRGLPDDLVLGDPDAILKGEAMDQVILDPLGYKARPLDGVWATPPYFHNGSVPSLYQVLLPASRRDPVFYLGLKRFDPKQVGYQTHQTQGAFKLDTSLTGNKNTGHEFRNLTLDELETAQGIKPDPTAVQDARWAAVLGVEPATYAKLSPAERWERVRGASRDARNRPDFQPIRGWLGVEFTDDERWQLVEYLKTL